MNKLLLLCTSLIQGCIMWIPKEIDYDIEIYLNEDRPDLRSDVGFISYECPSDVVPCPRCWGFELYQDSLRDNELKVFLYPTELRDFDNRYNWILNCADIVNYPLADEAKSFSSIDLTAFTNSTQKCMDLMYGAYIDNNGHREYGRKRKDYAAFKLYSSSRCSAKYGSGMLTEINQSIEHTLQAWLLRNRFYGIKELKEKRESMYAYRLILCHPIPYNKITKTESGIIYKLLDDEDIVVGSLTVRYPIYMDIIEGIDGEYTVERNSMRKFIAMYCDKKCSGKYKGIATVYVDARSCDVIDCKIGELDRCDN